MGRNNKRARAAAKRARKTAKRKKRLARRSADPVRIELAFDWQLDLTETPPHDLESLLERCGQLKAALVEFTQMHPDSLRGPFDLQQNPRDFDVYVLHGSFRDGRTVLDAFLEETEGITEADRTLVQRWPEDIVGIFELVARRDDHILLHNLVDGLDYLTRSNLGTFLQAVPTEGWILGRLVPLLDAWLVSGPLSIYPPETPRAEILRFAVTLAQNHPRQVARNPERRAAAAQMARDEAAFFEKTFGGFDVVVRGGDVKDVLTRYYSDWVHSMPSPRNGFEPHGSIDIPAGLDRHNHVGILFDETWGLGLYPDYDLFREAFRDPRRGIHPPFSETVRGYLDSPGVDPLPFLVVARQLPENMSLVLAALLGRPGFRWEHHGDALMRERKPDHFPPPLHIIPIPRDQADAVRGEASPSHRAAAASSKQLSLW